MPKHTTRSATPALPPPRRYALLMSVDEPDPVAEPATVPRSLRVLRGVAWLALLFPAAAMAFAFLWPDNPERTTLTFDLLGAAAFVLRSATLHAGLAFLGLAIIAELLRERRLRLWAALAGALLAGPTLLALIPRAAAPAAVEPVRVMTLNLLHSNTDLDAVEASIRAADPDLLVVQEFGPAWAATLPARLADRWPHLHAPGRADDGLAPAIFSRRPFLRAETVRLGDGWWPADQPAVLVTHQSRELLVVGVHMPTPTSLDLITQNRRYHRRLAQLATRRGQSFIIAGDFNAAPSSVGSHDLRHAGFVDAFAAVGTGPGFTWPALGLARLAPGFRIDQLWATPDLTPRAAALSLPTGSDHRPVVAEWTWKPTP